MRIEGLSDARPYSLSNQVTKETAEKKVRSIQSGELKATYTASVGGKEGLKEISLAEPTRFREASITEVVKSAGTEPQVTEEIQKRSEAEKGSGRLSIDV